MSYVFELDGIMLSDEPMDWDKMKIVIERDPVLSGIVVKYIDKLTFTGDGYSYLLSQVDDNGYCGTVTFAVREQVNGYDDPTLFRFNGIIDISNIKIDRTKCTAETAIEDDTLGQLLSKHKGLKVSINEDTKTLNGETLAVVGTNITFDLPILMTKKGIYVKHLIQYLLSYISDNRITFVSDWFQTKYLQQQWTDVVCSSVGGAGTEIGTATTFYDPDTYVELWNYAHAGILSAFDYGRDVVRPYSCYLWFPGVGGTESLYGNFLNRIYGAYFYENNHPEKVRITNFCDFDLTATNATVTVSQTFQDGASNAVITTGAWLQDKNEYPQISFGELMDELNKLYNLELRMTKTLTGYECRIEPQSYWVSDVSSFTVSEISNVTESVADDVIFRNIEYENGYDDPEYLFNGGSWTMNNCGVNDKSLSLKFKYGINAITQYSSLSNNDILYFETVPGTDNAAYYYMTKINNPIAGHLPGNFPTMSASALNLLVIKRNLGFSYVSATRAGKTITVNSEQKIKRKNLFQSPLCWADMSSYLSSPTTYINFTNDNIGLRKGYLKKIEYDVRTNMAKFELYSQ